MLTIDQIVNQADILFRDENPFSMMDHEGLYEKMIRTSSGPDFIDITYHIQPYSSADENTMVQEYQRNCFNRYTELMRGQLAANGYKRHRSPLTWLMNRMLPDSKREYYFRRGAPVELIISEYKPISQIVD